MSIRGDITIDWGASPRIIDVNSGSGELTIQDLYDTVRSLADDPEAMDDDDIIDAGGKEGGLVAVTVTLKNAKVKFQNTGTPRLCKILGGNLFAIDGDGYDMNPIAYNTNVTATFAQSTAAALVQDADIDAIKARVDSGLQVDLETVHGAGSWEGGGNVVFIEE